MSRKRTNVSDNVRAVGVVRPNAVQEPVTVVRWSLTRTNYVKQCGTRGVGVSLKRSVSENVMPGMLGCVPKQICIRECHARGVGVSLYRSVSENVMLGVLVCP